MIYITHFLEEIPPLDRQFQIKKSMERWLSLIHDSFIIISAEEANSEIRFSLQFFLAYILYNPPFFIELGEKKTSRIKYFYMINEIWQ